MAPGTAPVVRLIFDLYARGRTVTEIIHILNEKGLRTVYNRPFGHNSLPSILKNEKYIGIYTYQDTVRIEDAIPPIVEPEVFYKVQEMLKYNQKAAAHKNVKADYLLTEKLFCGKCGQMMVGVSGTSHTGTRHHYYSCNTQCRKQCDKRPVRKMWIKGLVLEYVTALIRNDDLLEFIAEKTYQYYLAQNTESSYTKSLQRALEDVEKATANLIRAMEAGIFNKATKQRMEELDGQRAELRDALTAARLREDLGLKKDHILYFLHRFAEMDVTDEDCQKQLIKIFVNSVFVYDDKVVMTEPSPSMKLTPDYSKAFVCPAPCATNFRKITADLAVIFRLTTEIPQTDFCFDHLTGTPFRECPLFCLHQRKLVTLNYSS